jgi:hypothetical protein
MDYAAFCRACGQDAGDLESFEKSACVGGIRWAKDGRTETYRTTMREAVQENGYHEKSSPDARSGSVMENRQLAISEKDFVAQM